MIDTDKYEPFFEFLTKHAPSTKKKIYVGETSSGRVQDELWDIAMSSLIEVKRLCEEVNTLNEIIDTERKKVYDIAQKLLEVIE